jgi:hypothetical protein
MDNPRILLLDTGRLRELILYAAIRDLGYSRLRPKIGYLRSTENYRNLTALISRFRRRVTTPHVVSELSAWVLRTIDTGRPRFWELVFDEFERMDMDEETLNLLKMPLELVASLGATDVSLLKVAGSFAPGNSILLSVDGALIKECKDAGLSALHVWEVIAA